MNDLKEYIFRKILMSGKTTEKITEVRKDSNSYKRKDFDRKLSP